MKNNFWKIFLAIITSMLLSACSVVKPYEREYLSDPLMKSDGVFTKQSLEQKFFSTQEGSVGGGTGVAGGCGCAI